MEENKKQPNNELKKFFAACDEFANGRFILADIKVAKILRAIADCEDIYNLLEECMINFDFDREFAKCKVKGSMGEVAAFRLPTEMHKLIPLVFCLLVELDSKKIDFNHFLKTQFPLANSQNEEYESFSNSIIVPFKKAIADLFNVTTDVEQKEESIENINPTYVEERESTVELPNGNTVYVKETTYVEETDEEDEDEDDDDDDEEEKKAPVSKDELFDEIKTQVYEIDDRTLFIKNAYKRGNMRLILRAMEEACNLKNLHIMSALVYSLNEIAKGEKSIRENVKEVNDLFYEFFNK